MDYAPNTGFNSGTPLKNVFSVCAMSELLILYTISCKEKNKRKRQKKKEGISEKDHNRQITMPYFFLSVMHAVIDFKLLKKK